MAYSMNTTVLLHNSIKWTDILILDFGNLTSSLDLMKMNTAVCQHRKPIFTLACSMTDPNRYPLISD